MPSCTRNSIIVVFKTAPLTHRTGRDFGKPPTVR
jgi:hypothetical protein